MDTHSFNEQHKWMHLVYYSSIAKDRIDHSQRIWKKTQDNGIRGHKDSNEWCADKFVDRLNSAIGRIVI